MRTKIIGGSILFLLILLTFLSFGTNYLPNPLETDPIRYEVIQDDFEQNLSESEYGWKIYNQNYFVTESNESISGDKVLRTENSASSNPIYSRPLRNGSMIAEEGRTYSAYFRVSDDNYTDYDKVAYTTYQLGANQSTDLQLEILYDNAGERNKFYIRRMGESNYYPTNTIFDEAQLEKDVVDIEGTNHSRGDWAKMEFEFLENDKVRGNLYNKEGELLAQTGNITHKSDAYEGIKIDTWLTQKHPYAEYDLVSRPK